MWLSTHYFSGLLQDLFHVFLYEIQLFRGSRGLVDRVLDLLSEVVG